MLITCDIFKGFHTAVFISARISSLSVDISPRWSRGLMATESLI